MILTYSKILLYFFEYHFMRVLAMIVGWPVPPLPKFTKEQKQTLNKAFFKLLNNWKIVKKQFPHCNPIENPVTHLSRYWSILTDLRTFAERKKRKESYDLPATLFDRNYPEYFKRNYHYQTDGYFSYDSAKRYDHQFEILFLGAGHVIRKVAYSLLGDVLKGNDSVLEFGASTGTSGHQFKLMFPQVKLDILDPSPTYLEYAKINYPDTFEAFIPEFIENFNSNKKYNCIFSTFIMHEIPVLYWDAIAGSIKSALKPGGHLLIVDSQQNHDKAEHQFGLDQFGEDFFEPYFPEYREKSLEDFFALYGFKLIRKQEVLFSKSLLFHLEG